MLKIFASVMFAATICSGAADAHGGGPAGTMPMTNFTDMPDYRPGLPARCGRSEHMCHHTRWHQGLYHSK